MSETIIVINPNSTVAVTEDIDRALAPLRFQGGPGIECLTLAEGPPGIETQEHVDSVVAPIRRRVEAEDQSAAAFVIACFSDPGLAEAREATAKPVFGIAESGLMSAMARAGRVGVIAILEASVARHRRFYAARGIEGRIAGELPLNLGVLELAEEKVAFARLTEVGGRLRDAFRAEILVLGCAGMARYRARLEATLGVPVIDPTQAAVAMAIAAVRLGAGSGRQRAAE
ncbi:MAG: aspartate/glutamate racemase family protein [Proteobacteria bacterium]|nr:aspartate/glutamate racemase family protein [Pseudomonadota bacterium]